MGLIKLKYGLLCLQAAFLCAGACARPVIIFETTNCETLAKKESLAVRQAYRRALIRGMISSDHRCLLKNVDQVDDIGALLEGIPENTVLFIVQKPVNDGSLSYTFPLYRGDSPDLETNGDDPLYSSYSRDHRLSLRFTTSRRKTPGAKVTQILSSSALIHITQLPETTQCVPSKTYAHIKKGTVLLGVNEHNINGSIPVCETEKPEPVRLMFEVGSDDRFEDTGKIYVSGFNFYPLPDNKPDPVASVWRLRCYTGGIYFEDNYFRLDTRSSVYLQCSHNTKENVYLSFRGNTVVGMGAALSQEGLLADLRHLESQQLVANLSDNWFAGNIKSAIEVRLDNGSRVNIKNNHIRPAMSEFRRVQNGLELHGPDSYRNGKKNTPQIIVSKNYLQTSHSSLVLYGELNISVASNQMKSGELLTTPFFTEEGDSTVPAVTLNSPALNSWFNIKGDCPLIQNESRLRGELCLVIKPNNKACNRAF